MTLRPIAVALFLLAGCGGGGSADAPPACDLGFDTLSGRTFVMLEAQADGKSTKENVTARLRFEGQGDDLKAKYTVGSLSDVYTYPCVVHERGDRKELRCFEEERPRDWCQALEVHEPGLCTKSKLKELGITRTSDEDLNAAIKKARETVKEFRGTDKWNHFVLNNNNLGNKLQGRLYVDLDPKRCRLSITDMYFTIFDGKGIEDTNPVGKNPFVETKDDLMFLHCQDGRGLADLTTAEVPADLSTIPPRREHQVDGDVHYHYLGESAVKAEDGCSYSYDSYAQWRPLKKGVAVEPDDKGLLRWNATHRYGAGDVVSYSGQPVGVYHMVRHKECGGEKQEIDVLCNAALVR